MSPDPVTVAPDDDADVATHTFRRHESRQLPAVDHRMTMGMITSTTCCCDRGKSWATY
ncbi:CBS domain-containing protein [Allosalinactinospora lopnorensis]|uniref:CBS domain-containing protein n=1 Tax=Allosalinactinospora lopnorensis TaxID=1352348 RepID=UPI00373FD258